MEKQSHYYLYSRVSAWNAQRYEREYNKQLLVKLLREELDETIAAKEPVHILDGRCDQIYVALGGIWKLNLSDEDIGQAFGVAFINMDVAVATGLTAADVNTAVALNIGAIQNPNLAMDYLNTAACLAMICLLNHYAIEEQFNVSAFDAVEIVCDANDTKAVQKVASDVKANIDKGSSFVPPEARLQALLDEVNANVKH